ncbi:hypothetical protein PSTG_14028 [Puccinia striiformis f. sp. tritici PST-78]|uniref:Uncharacterized protein n=1 Tax=Puccinia striiformis f. sp. tritici PST-78 TaxID=1165861 RepID=A0A0L0UZY7_9BASI|nr:hypothetical protein PSTG_14028 [Puccinia striiformis f. sp. tritici PST-78]
MGLHPHHPASSFSSWPHPRIQMPTPLPLRIQTPLPPPLHPSTPSQYSHSGTKQLGQGQSPYNLGQGRSPYDLGDLPGPSQSTKVQSSLSCRPRIHRLPSQNHAQAHPTSRITSSADLAALKTQGHVEYPLALLLVEIQKPSKFILSQWSNCIASSIQLTAQDHAVKPPSLSDLNNNNLDSHLRILEYLNSCKTSASPSNPEDGKLRNDMTLKPLYQLHDLIIDIFITYSIIRGSAVADVEPDTTSAESQALVLQKKELDKHRSRHNYTPFCLYLVAGYRGLILAPTNRQFTSGASALGFLTAVQHIFIKNIPRHEGLEPVWKRLGVYIDNLFIDSFLTPNCLFNFCQPQIIPLAQAITSDFLACVQNQFPAQNFKLPQAVTAQ